MDFAQLFVCCTYVCSILFMEKGKYLQMLPRPTATPRVDTKKSIGFVHSSLQSILYQTGPMCFQSMANLGEGGLPGTNSFSSSSSSSTTLPFSSCSNGKVINYKVADQLSRQEIFSHLNTFFGAWFWVVTHLFTWRGEYENFSEILRIFEKMPETFVSWLEKNNHRGVSDNQELVIVSVTFKDVLDVEKYLLQLLRWHRFRHLLDSRHNPRGNDWPKHWNSDRFWFVCVQTVWVSHGNWKK